MKFCEDCGKQNPEGANFCVGCGQSVNGDTQAPAQYQHTNYNGSVFAVLGWLFAGISILFFPIPFAAGGVIFGYLHRKIDQTHGTIIIIGAIACGLFGTVLGAAVTY